MIGKVEQIFGTVHSNDPALIALRSIFLRRISAFRAKTPVIETIRFGIVYS